MSELKPCPFCGGEAYQTCIVGTVKCLQCGASTIVDNWNDRATPELPDGYCEEDRNGCASLINIKCGIIAWIGDALGSLYTNSEEEDCLDAEHIRALTIWLQRRPR